ncbi:MAG: hypothetical protein KatS3mg026_1223 [Bacteroidia bacterium]|nr:MAG: hypothetical protein KatS3mg026_1223 [Bacteroidia bacterium]
MKRTIWFLAVGLAQNVGIGTTAPTHRLHLADVSPTDKGLLRVDALASPAGAIGTFSPVGNLGKVNFTGDPKDLLRGDLTWGPDATDWRLVGNAGTDPTQHFLGTTDNQPLVFRTNSVERMRFLTDGRVWINTTTDLTPANNTLNILSQAGAGQRALTARSDTIGLYGEATADLGPGIAGVYASTATGGIGFFARGNALNTFPTVINPAGFVAQGTIRGIMGEARSTTVEPRMGGYFTNNSAATWSRVGARSGGNNYKIQGTGTVNTVVQNGKGGVYLLTAPEAPEFLFLDFGQARLERGQAYIGLEPVLLPHIDTQRLQVWVTPLEPCAGLYVVRDPAGKGFYVRERGSGQGAVAFMWGWSAPVKSWGRFPPVSPPSRRSSPGQP